ncbi:MAG: tRNA pseudouridine(55) synthase TruB [Ignavibacteriae bacterium]|nr:tRNA pseudouridine(55) synthase TruB [Ignavibacteriota bacterium]
MYTDKIILTDKPLDWTSTDVVRFLKKKLSLKKVGHAGSLDPRATGLLILCTDKMTKRINEFMDYEKEYQGIIRIGARTKTYDTESEEEDFREVSGVSGKMIEDVRKTFVGETEQIPPMHSALKLNGRPLYKLARKGETVELKARKIVIKEFGIKRLNDEEIFFNIICSKGTYIRSIANDFGEKLGVGGYLKELRRTRIGIYDLNNLNETAGEIKFSAI